MSLICDFTGAQIFLEEYRVYALCDAYVSSNGTFVFRISSESMQPIRGDIVHYTVDQIDQWWDRRGPNVTSTLASTKVRYHGRLGRTLGTRDK